MSHQNKPPTGSPLHAAHPSAFRHILSPTPIQIPDNAQAASNPEPRATREGDNDVDMQARSRQMHAAAVATGHPAAPVSPAAPSAVSSARAPPTPPSTTRSAATPPAHILPLQLQTKVLQRQTPARSSPITAAPQYPLPTYSSTPTAQHTRMLSASSANAMLMMQQQQTQQLSNAPPSRKPTSVTAPTPSPPQSERNSPATVMGAREQTTQQTTQPTQHSAQAASLAAFPVSHSYPVVVPPPQFGTVAPFLFRCGRFQPDTHGAFVRDLHLRSIVYLSNPTEHPISSAIKHWAADHGVEVVNIGASVFGSAPVCSPDSGVSEQDWHHSVAGSSSASFLTLYSELVRLSLEHVLLASNSPVLLMCANGVELCSLVVGCLRRLQRWTYTSLLDEFTRATSATQLRESRCAASGGGGPGANRSAHHHHKSEINSSCGSTAASGASSGGPSCESVWITGTGCIRYAAAACNSTDLHRYYRLEELMELFDLKSVRIPELRSRKRAETSAVGSATPAVPALSSSVGLSVSPCVEWYRKQRALERREHRAQKQAKQRRLMQQLHTVLAAQSESSASNAANPLACPSEPSVSIPVVSLVPPLCSWSSDLSATYHSNRLLSAGLRFDKKATLVDEDED